MYGSNHAILGAAGGFLAGTYLEAPFTTRIIMTAIGAFGGLLPDADTESSLLGRYLPKRWHKLTPGHRGFTHSLLYCAIVLGLGLTVQLLGHNMGLWNTPEHPFVPIALTVGALTHLFADSLTIQGVPLLYPVYKRKFRLLGPLSFKTGSGVEPAAVALLLSIAVAYVLMPYTQGFADTFSTPTILGIGTEGVIVFIATAALCLLTLTIYSRSRRTRTKCRKPRAKRR